MGAPLLAFPPDARLLARHAGHFRLPLWLPWPAPPGWRLAGHGYATGDDAGEAATVVAWSGPGPLGGPAELLVVAEEPGAGLGAALAGLTDPDPGPRFGAGPPQSRIRVDAHAASLWWVSETPQDRAAYAGEAAGRWLWLVFHPETAGAMLLEPLSLVSAAELGCQVDLIACGEPSVRLLIS